MREILFKGKRIDNGEWIIGLFIKDCEIYGYKDEHTYIVTHEHPSSCFGSDIYFEVLPETVGQYTGLTDKNGKKIFEGDLLEWIDRIVAVVWFDFNAQFDSNFIRYCNDKIVTNFKGIEPSDWHECKVIGNVFDNPELLEVN